ncbi:unnamed protein product [Strongylus vulgaris]|uniref:small monomeric GTPase n=1 Tax=Strongylus vulgaris TaxID=40348 RepID=A0A3P7JA14_STRVU|nr:unnamed protein product [Strongylus vulgaris]
MTEHENPAYRETDDDSMSCDEDNCRRIRECKIGVMGASGVGKTSLNSDECIRTSQGFVIMYSITDRESFYEAADIYTLIEQVRGGKVNNHTSGSYF